jgi:hypothetical protein
MARNIAAKFTALGGRILYRTRVDRIQSRDGKVTGVQAGEQEIPAAKVIISEDARTAIDHLFGAPLQEGWAVRMRRSLETMQCMFLCIGTDASLTEYPRSLNFLLKEPFEAAGLTFNNFNISCYSGDPFYAPDGGSVLTCLLIGNSYAFWKAAREDGTYAARKQDVVSRKHDLLLRHPEHGIARGVSRHHNSLHPVFSDADLLPVIDGGESVIQRLQPLRHGRIGSLIFLQKLRRKALLQKPGIPLRHRLVGDVHGKISQVRAA